MQNIGQLAVKVRVLSPEDSIGRASEVVRASTVGAAPVVAHGRLVGLVTAAGLAEALTRVPPPDAEREQVRALPLEQAFALPETLHPSDALQFLQTNDVARAPVLDISGCLVGMISQAEIALAVCRRDKPAPIGGMATPFGVYLTGGGVRGGVGDLALMSTGAFMALMFVIALLITERLLAPEGWLMRIEAIGRWFGSLSPDGQSMFSSGAMFILFALLFRLSWVTGYHAAEHQVVHAMEAGDDLRPDVVAAKPRVHPRCGTNLVAAIMLMTLFWERKELRDLAAQPLLAMIVTISLWRRVGGWIQQHVTTRPASPGQIASGIAAGRQLMERFQEHGGSTRGGIWRRIWNMGLLQVMLGYLLVFGCLEVLGRLGAPIPAEARFF